MIEERLRDGRKMAPQFNVERSTPLVIRIRLKNRMEKDNVKSNEIYNG